MKRLPDINIDRQILYRGFFKPVLLVMLCMILSCVFSTPNKSTRSPEQEIVKDQKYYENQASATLKARPQDAKKLKRVVDEGLNRFPRSATLWSCKASYHLANPSRSPGEANLALEAAKKALELQPADAGKRFHLGVVYQAALMDYASAIMHYEKAERLGYGKQFPGIHYNMARCYVKLERFDEARRHYLRCIEAKPQGTLGDRAKKELAQLHQKRKPVKKREYYERACKEAFETKDMKRLKQITDEGLQSYPKSSKLWTCKVGYHLKVGSPDRHRLALEAAQTALALEPENPAKHSDLGWVYQEVMKDYASALIHYRKAEDNGYAAKWKGMYFNMGLCYEKTGKISQSRSYYSKYLEEEPEGKHATVARKRLAALSPQTLMGVLTVGEPNAAALDIHTVEIAPVMVSAGESFDLMVDYTVSDTGVSDASVPIKFSYRILQGQAVLYSPEQVEIESENGKQINWTEHLTAGDEAGLYRIEVTIQYKDMVKTAGVDLRIR